eukprot:gene9999-10153_t
MAHHPTMKLEMLTGRRDLALPPPQGRGTPIRKAAADDKQVNHYIKDVSNTLWALAVLQLAPTAELHEFLLSRAQLHSAQLKPQELSNILWALSQLKLVPSSSWLQDVLLRQVANKQQWLQSLPQFLAASAAALAESQPQEICNTIWALAKLKVAPSTAWLLAFDQATLACMDQFTAQGLADVLAAQVYLKLSPSAAWLEAWLVAVQRVWGSADSPAVCKMLWAAANFRVPVGRTWLAEALKVSYASIQHDLQNKRLPVEDFLRLMWAVGHLRRGGHLYQGLSDTLALHCCQAAAGMSWRQLAKGAEAMARLQPLPQPHLIQVQWVIKNICAQMSDKQQCSDLVKGLTPALVEWLRANASPEVLCAEAGAKPQRQHVLQKPNDMTCPLCMFVASKLKERIADPVTQEDIHQASLDACAALPQGVMQDACTTFVNQYEMTFVKYVGTMEPSELCMLIGTCLDTAVARMGVAQPLKPNSAVALSQMMVLAQALQTVQAAPSNDHCETCKVVVLEMHQLVANPELQVQLVEYAKQACQLVPSLTASCQADVDQYAPMVFGMILAYLQPDQVCVQLKLCPPPSWHESLVMQAHNLYSKYNKYSLEAKVIKA